MNIARQVPLKTTVMVALIVSMLVTYMTGCSTINRGSHEKGIANIPSVASSVMYIPIMATRQVTIHDTLKVKPKLLSRKQYDSLINIAYKANYDLFFAPQFSKMNRVIDNQANSINGLQAIIASMRERSIKRVDSDKSAYNKLQNMYFNVQKKQEEKNASQIAEIKSIINFLLALAAIMIFAIVLGFILGFILWKRTKNLYKSFSNV